ncbi:MAG: hypothetical protein LUD82_07430, partial [Clostridiales bacterium]|nr:hypothetical protein [Clostridiales bacterium]
MLESQSNKIAQERHKLCFARKSDHGTMSYDWISGSKGSLCLFALELSSQVQQSIEEDFKGG